jgi:hypothetical protein
MVENAFMAGFFPVRPKSSIKFARPLQWAALTARGSATRSKPRQPKGFRKAELQTKLIYYPAPGWLDFATRMAEARHTFDQQQTSNFIMRTRLLAAITGLICLCGCSKPVALDQAPPPEPPAAAAPSASAATNDMITTPSGLKYMVLKKGTGNVSPNATNVVKVDYQGTLLDGTVFDSSYKRGTPATFPLSRVIRGWTEGLQLMKVGDKFKFQIPPELAYGSRARPGIPANSTLVFEVELLEIQ